jgi:hypothetical protein
MQACHKNPLTDQGFFILKSRTMKKTCIQRFSSTLALVAPSVVMVASQADGAA